MNSISPDHSAPPLSALPSFATKPGGLGRLDAPTAPLAWRTRPAAVSSTADVRFAPGEWMRTNRELASSGGIVTADELADLLRRHTGHGLSQVARWLVAGELISFRHLGQTQVPLFQFDLRDMTLRNAAQDVAAEMRDVFESVELTRWFAEANSWLAGIRPADHLGIDAPAVLAAARADRFIATGWS